MEDLVALRRQLHRVAEVAGNEGETAQVLQEWLAAHGLQPAATGIAGHGLLYRVGAAPRVLLRADLDALPWRDASGVAHAATTGAHHACGHDGHMAMLAGALLAIRDAGGSAYGFFQPAEETGEGAAASLRHPALDLELDACFAIHNVPGMPLGQVSVRDGAAAVASRGVSATFVGVSSHAATPHEGRSPVSAVAGLAEEIQGFGGDDAALATVVHLRVGERRFGTSPGDGEVAATLRAASDAALASMESRIRERAQELANADELTLRVDVIEPFPAVYNDSGAVERVRAAGLAAGLQVTEAEPMAWSEDFAHFTARWPGALILLGSGPDQPPLHSPRYDFPDDLLEKGVALWRHLA